MAKQKTILIMGAGLGGLTAAVALTQRGFRVRVHEQAPFLGELGAGLTLPVTSMRVFDALGIWDQVREATTDVQGMAFVHYQTRELLHGSHDYGWDHKPETSEIGGHAYRATIHAILVNALKALDPEAVILGHRVRSVSQDATGVEAVFENGDTAKGDLLIGADGVRSITFRSVFGSDNPARFTGVIAIRCLLPRDEQIAPYLTGGRAMQFIGPSSSFNRYGIEAGKMLNCVGLVRTDSWTQEGWTHPCSRDEFMSFFSDFHRDITGLIEHAPENNLFKWALYAREPLTTWTSGRITMLGDAAHPMLPFLGQGATAAIEDGLVLARSLEAYDDYAAAFNAYESERLERTTEQIRASAQQGEALNEGPDRYNKLRPDQAVLSGYDPRSTSL